MRSGDALMADRTATAEKATARRDASMVQVWDPFVRVFHWSLVLLVGLAFLTGDEIEWLHLAGGYAIVALLAARLVWGFVGPRHARFSQFVRPPRATMAYPRQAIRFRAPRYLGHTPAGGAMVVALLLLLGGVLITGLLMTTDAYWGSKTLEIVHKTLAYVLLGLVGLHVAGVAFSSFAHRENLVRAMITGRKRRGP
jgi:cytochrome b